MKKYITVQKNTVNKLFNGTKLEKVGSLKPDHSTLPKIS